ncbi:hypothetical protein BCR36DRAFT_582904 [Piromyces finnis]|uniref:Uncharacterized protein n=1 Tax=Piromyces finnis TaxID=1754191 RepID=A0A1Y1VAS7_9FUNG|nr:hypothetical protein BCR36DRAFT_582904 [Piromyces finnis]|eukprot:ORX51357.1 hypothetical protein BCR36DRAFT_582904 [Piromyces finnis]
MKTLNFLFVMAVCFMTISHVSANYYIIKTFENYGSKSDEGAEGHLDSDGQKRVDCFVGLIGNKVNKPQTIFYKSDGVDKNGNVKVNSRKFTAEAIAAKIGVGTEALSGDDTALATIKDTLVNNQITDAIFVWTDKEKASKLAQNLGATNAPKEFKKSNYGLIWNIENDSLTEMNMDCADVSNVVKSGASTTFSASILALAVSVMASLYLLF